MSTPDETARKNEGHTGYDDYAPGIWPDWWPLVLAVILGSTFLGVICVIGVVLYRVLT